jgi:hypothetical protein
VRDGNIVSAIGQGPGNAATLEGSPSDSGSKPCTARLFSFWKSLIHSSFRTIHLILEITHSLLVPHDSSHSGNHSFAPLFATAISLHDSFSCYILGVKDRTHPSSDGTIQRERSASSRLTERLPATMRPQQVRKTTVGSIRLRWGKLDLAAVGLPAIVFALILGASVALRLFR